jgi:hypothetical protein
VDRSSRPADRQGTGTTRLPAFFRFPGVDDDVYGMTIDEVHSESTTPEHDALVEVFAWCGRRIARDLWENADAEPPWNRWRLRSGHLGC